MTKSNLPVPHRASELAPLDALAQVPEETIWLANYPSKATRATYRDAVANFIAAAGLKNKDDFRKVGRAAVIAWRDKLIADGKSVRTVNTWLSALRSLFDHLVIQNLIEKNPAKEVKPPKLRVRRGETKALTPKQARKLLDAPPEDTLQGLRDRAILAVGFHVGPRRAEIAKLKVKDFHEEQEHPALRLKRKGGVHGSVVIHPSAASRINAYLEEAGHAQDKDGPLFRPVRANPYADKEDRHLIPKQIDRLFKRWCRKISLKGDFSSHSTMALSRIDPPMLS